MVDETTPPEDSSPAEELEMLLGKVDTLRARLQSMKLKADIGEAISAEDLDLAVEDISRLDTVMRPRRDVGH